MKTNQFFWKIVLVISVALLIVACAPSPPGAPAAQAGQGNEEEHAGPDEHQEEMGMHSPEQHMAGMHHDVPAEAAAVPNPISATDDNLATGKQLFATSCALCHGESGEGNGPGAAELEKPPANLHEAHVQDLSDGALFYIISHGRPETPMPAWEKVLNEEQRWQVVNYLRTFKAGEHHADDEHHEEEGEHHEAD